MSEDWLALEAPAADSSRQELVVSDDPPAPAEPVLPVAPPGIEDRNSLVARIWAGLTKQQRLFLEIFEEFNFVAAAALRVMVWKCGDMAPSKTTVARWKREPDFAFIVRVMKSKLAAEALEKEDIVAHSVHIREQALAPKPILYQGEPTGYDENQPEVALRANEQLAKIGGHMKQDDSPVTGQGPAFVIQVIQQGGGVVDVTPKGVTIDLPVPVSGTQSARADRRSVLPRQF